MFKRYYKTGKKQEESNFQKGKKHGFSKWFYDNESLNSVYKYQLGNIQDTIFNYYKNGNLKSFSIFKNNELHGASTKFYKSGNIKVKGHYYKGLKSGDWCHYDSLGVLIKCNVF